VLLVPAVVFVRGPRCQQSTLCPPWFSLSALSSSCFSCFFCLRACPPAGRAAQGEPPRDGGQKYALTCSMCIFPLLLFKPSSQQIHLVTSRAERAPSRWREFPAKLFFRAPQASADGGDPAPRPRCPGGSVHGPDVGRGKDSRGQSASTTAEMGSRSDPMRLH